MVHPRQRSRGRLRRAEGWRSALDDLDLPEEKLVVTVCGAGRTSEISAERPRAQGFDALSLEGGMKAWRLAWNAANVPVAGPEAEVVQVRRTGKVQPSSLAIRVGLRCPDSTISATWARRSEIRMSCAVLTS